MKCAVGKCKENNSKKTTVSFYNFPKDATQRKQWIMFCKRVKRVNANKERICSLHFKQEDFERNLKFEMGFSNRRTPRLKPGAVPSIDKSASVKPIEIPTIDDKNTLIKTEIIEDSPQEIHIKTLEEQINALRQENAMLKREQSSTAKVVPVFLLTNAVLTLQVIPAKVIKTEKD